MIVGIGASAGGLAAFKSFLANLPVDTGMAFVLVQHLAPDHKSLLVELLAAKSPLPVVTAMDGMAVKPNSVYVIPPGQVLQSDGGDLRLAEIPQGRARHVTVDIVHHSSVDVVADAGDLDGPIISSARACNSGLP